MPVATAPVTIILSVMDEFSRTPGPRFKDEGPYAGEVFRREHLEPKFKEALNSGNKILVDLDGTAGYATSFLEEAFGGLARKYDPDTVLKILDFKSEDEPYLEVDIRRYIREANKK